MERKLPMTDTPPPGAGETPRTDVVVDNLSRERSWSFKVACLSTLARQIERELTAATGAAQRWYAAASPYATPEALREALQELTAATGRVAEVESAETTHSLLDGAAFLLDSHGFHHTAQFILDTKAEIPNVPARIHGEKAGNAVLPCAPSAGLHCKQGRPENRLDGGERPAPFVQDEHHASCRYSDMSLVWLCEQCGKRSHTAAQQVLDDLADSENALATARREVAALTPDAERYRWLRESGIVGLFLGFWKAQTAAQLDATIDRALASRGATPDSTQETER